MTHIKAFIAGILFPAMLFPFVRYFMHVQKLIGPEARSLQWFIIFMTLAWGFWNVIFFALEENCPMRGKAIRPWFFGIMLGLITSAIGVFVIDMPEKVFGLTGALQYIPLLIVPVVYGVIWKYLIHFINVLVGVRQ